MSARQLVTLTDVGFRTLHSCERSTALHISEFHGHEKNYQIDLLGQRLEIFWRKGQMITYAQAEPGPRCQLHSQIESKAVIEIMFVRVNSKDIEIDLPHERMENFCRDLDAIELGLAVELNIPQELIATTTGEVGAASTKKRA
ncbi:MAG: hypothetical protein MI864_16850 [Pseudomonadales bacterium]|nr:hypothetical protein [Pseudomonadales bacterium]